MSTPFIVKRQIVGAGPTVRFAVYEDLGLCAGLTWQPWFTSSDEEEAHRYAAEAAKIIRSHGRYKLAGKYWCEVSPRSGIFGQQFNVYQTEGFFGLGHKLMHSSLSLEDAEAWAVRAAKLSA